MFNKWKKGRQRRKAIKYLEDNYYCSVHGVAKNRPPSYIPFPLWKDYRRICYLCYKEDLSKALRVLGFEDRN